MSLSQAVSVSFDRIVFEVFVVVFPFISLQIPFFAVDDEFH